MLSFPNCKINIGLYITRRRSDGYHDLETIFYPVSFTDVLEIVPAPATSINMSGLPVAGNTSDNLVLRAYDLLQSDFPEQIKPVDIYLHKVIPMGAGLGGGSADGAFMLTLLNSYFNLKLSKAQLADYALQLGSDCPFFIYNTPCLATGRGEQMTPIPLDLSAYSLQLICPSLHVSTRDAFSTITPGPAPLDLSQLQHLPVEQWRGNMSNDFEKTVFRLHPLLATVKEQLYTQGAIYASMSGSGSALYGLFPKGKKATIETIVAFTEHYIE